MENICLYDFVAEYAKDGVREDGNTKYRLLNKPVLPNHKIYNPSREEERESYYYSLLCLFVPFRNKEDLSGNGENAEIAFNRENHAMNTLAILHGRGSRERTLVNRHQRRRQKEIQQRHGKV